MTYYRDRSHAGKALAKSLNQYSGNDDVIILALPRGGVPVAFEVAQELDLPLDLLLVRKLGLPGQEEYAMGAIAESGITYINQEVVRQLSIPKSVIDRVIAKESRELDRRRQIYRGNRPPLDLEGKTVIIVDDGLATGSTMRAAVNALKQAGPKSVVVAVPVGADDSCRELELIADKLICLHSPSPFYGVGMWYRDFGQTSDPEVLSLLERANAAQGAKS